MGDDDEMLDDENEGELGDDYRRVVESSEGFALEVCTIEWATPYTPCESWVRYRLWKRPPSAARLATWQQRALEDTRFFRVCTTCNERQSVGQMHDEQMCQGCAERHLGVIH